MTIQRPEDDVLVSAAPNQEAVKDVRDVKQDTSVVDKIFDQLRDDEKEQCARASSYRYLVASQSPTYEGGKDERDRHAKSMIERFVTVEQKLNKKSPNEWEEAATMKLMKTLAYRAQKQVDDLLLSFDKDKLTDDSEVYAKNRAGLEERFARGNSVVRGYSKDGLAIFHNFPRTETSWEQEYYIKGNIYMLERALACTERKTNGEKDKAYVLYDYKGYGNANRPPTHLVKELLSDLRDYWPERLEHVYIVDAPFVFRAFWMIVKHFIDPITKELVKFVTGEEQKKVFRDIISPDQAMPYMFEGGKYEEEADMKTFFYDTQFDHVYEEKQN